MYIRLFFLKVDLNDRLYLISSGKVEVRTGVAQFYPFTHEGYKGLRLGRGNGHELGKLMAGESFGDGALLDARRPPARLATVLLASHAHTSNPTHLKPTHVKPTSRARGLWPLSGIRPSFARGLFCDSPVGVTTYPQERERARERGAGASCA